REKGRSPVKGLFPFSLSSASSASATSTTTPRPIQVPRPPLVSVDGDAPEEDDEDAWVDADNDDNDNDDDEGGDDGRGRLGPCTRWGRRAADARTVALRAACTASSVNVHVCAPPAYYESEGEGEERRRPSRIRMNGRRRRRPTWRRSGRGRGKESRWAGSRSGDHHVACYRHVHHDALSAFPESSSVSVSEYCIHPRSLARHDRSRSLPPSLSPSPFLSLAYDQKLKFSLFRYLVYCLYHLSLSSYQAVLVFS
ncbi:hypothetical protein B0H14DRAFT_3787948, partial [Mycena olivaceomarginata]